MEVVQRISNSCNTFKIRFDTWEPHISVQGAEPIFGTRQLWFGLQIGGAQGLSSGGLLPGVLQGIRATCNFQYLHFEKLPQWQWPSNSWDLTDQGCWKGRRVFSCQVPITKIRPPADAKGGEGKKGMGDKRFFWWSFLKDVTHVTWQIGLIEVSLCPFSQTKLKVDSLLGGKKIPSWNKQEDIWVFPKIVVPPKSSILNRGCPLFSPSILGVPLFLGTPIWCFWFTSLLFDP